MTTTKKARYRQALRYGRRLERRPEIRVGGLVLPPSCSIAYAHHMNPHYNPLRSRREWKRDYGR